MEAEYTALSDAIRELLAGVFILNKLGISNVQPAAANPDSQASATTAKKKAIADTQSTSSHDITS